MTSEEVETLNIKILNQELKIKCLPKDIPALEEAVAYITDKVMALKRDKNIITTIDNIGLITALNVAHELITERKTCQIPEPVSAKIKALHNKISEAL